MLSVVAAGIEKPFLSALHEEEKLCVPLFVHCRASTLHPPLTAQQHQGNLRVCRHCHRLSLMAPLGQGHTHPRKERGGNVSVYSWFPRPPSASTFDVANPQQTFHRYRASTIPCSVPQQRPSHHNRRLAVARATGFASSSKRNWASAWCPMSAHRQCVPVTPLTFCVRRKLTRAQCLASNAYFIRHRAFVADSSVASTKPTTMAICINHFAPPS